MEAYLANVLSRCSIVLLRAMELSHRNLSIYSCSKAHSVHKSI